ncbi:MAG: hypothetical protein ACKO4Q_10380 [Planctomycetota bacterium]
MSAQATQRRSLPLELAALGSALVLAGLLSWARIALNEVYLPGALENVAGIDPRGAAEPFAHRVLVPRLVRFLCEHVLVGSQPRAVFHALDTLFAFAAFVATRRLAGALFERRWMVHASAWGLFPLLAIHYVASREYPFWYAWDMAAVAVFAWGLVLLFERRWTAFYALFALGTFNRETTCFLTFALLFTGWRSEPKLRLVAHCAAQLALWLGIKWWLRSLFRRQPGDVYQSVWLENWESLQDPLMWRWYLLAFGGLWLCCPSCAGASSPRGCATSCGSRPSSRWACSSPACGASCASGASSCRSC